MEEDQTIQVLMDMWVSNNERFFGGKLKPPLEITWQELSGENGMGCHGVYFDKSNCIAIDEKFKFDPAMVELVEDEARKANIADCLVLHEMIHQAMHQNGEPKFGKHGEAFIREASRVALIAGGTAPTSREEAERWPLLF